MSSPLIASPESKSQEYRNTEFQPQNPVIRVVAKLISYIFHPLFVPVYIVAFLLACQPQLFSGFPPGLKFRLMAMSVLMYMFFPLVTVLLAKALGFVQSVYLKTQKERVIPYIASGIYYFWIAYVLRNQSFNPHELMQLAIAIFLASSAGLIANIYMKVSMHAMSMGVLVMFMVVLAAGQTSNFTIYTSIAVLIAGLVCTARLIVSDHSPKEIYTGLFIGAAAQLVGVWADGILP